ncbi:hypothetical protein HDU84_006912 [Entophlyctis sp. JEL0112]|nr:hypothetical protein HDU84_006912 [Entophlyctis sp. JEL0112]
MNLVNSDLAHMRLTYKSNTLDDFKEPAEVDPLQLFDVWLTDAKTVVDEANAMCLSTVDESLKPASRIVLLKSFDDRGYCTTKSLDLLTDASLKSRFVFYTNYTSRKSKHLTTNPHASLSFFWKERQVRIEGRATRISSAESDSYFQTRPRESKIGAWVSDSQSSPVVSRAELEARERVFVERFEGVEDIPRPDYWGGWRVSCDYIEFWQGRVGRLHDRIVFQKVEASGGADASNGPKWNVTRLMP